MQFEDLKSFRGLAKLIERKENKIARLEAKAKATVSSLTGAPGRSGISDKVGDGASEILDENANLERLKARQRELIKYIEGITDAKVQQAIEMYVYEERSWTNIGIKLYYSGNGIRQKVEKYMNG